MPFLKWSLLLVVVLSGCANPTFGPLPRNFRCVGKATLVGSASGFSGVNAIIDCGDGFSVLTNSENAPVLPR